MNHGMRSSIYLCVCLVLAGCESQKVRDAAGNLGKHVGTIKGELTTFSEARKPLIQARALRVESLESSARQSYQTHGYVTDTWRYTTDGPARQALLNDLLVEADEAAAVFTASAQRQAAFDRELAALRSGVATRSDELKAVQSALAELAESQSFETWFAFMGSYLGQVKKSLDELEEKAKSVSQQGAEKVAVPPPPKPVTTSSTPTSSRPAPPRP